MPSNSHRTHPLPIRSRATRCPSIQGRRQAIGARRRQARAIDFISDRNRPAVDPNKGRPGLCKNCQCTRGADEILPWLALDNSESIVESIPIDRRRALEPTRARRLSHQTPLSNKPRGLAQAIRDVYDARCADDALVGSWRTARRGRCSCAQDAYACLKHVRRSVTVLWARCSPSGMIHPNNVELHI